MTLFQEKVYQALKKIPRGRVATYAYVARMIGAPRAVRAVGTACGKNPTLIVVPCHRVVRSDGSLGGYAGGLPKKIALLKKEGVSVMNGKVDLHKYHYVPPLRSLRKI